MKLFRQIRREAARSPQKAAVLGLLALVAVWFWAPLVLDWMKGGAQTKASAATAGTPPLVPELVAAGNARVEPPVSGSPTGAAAAPTDWQEVIAHLDADPKADVATLGVNRDPFTTIDFPPLHDSLVGPSEEVEEPKEEKTPEVSPQEAGLALSSTLVGPDGGLALISGKTYRPQDKIVVPYSTTTLEFTLAEVHPRRVVLLREGKPYDLKIPRAHEP